MRRARVGFNTALIGAALIAASMVGRPAAALEPSVVTPELIEAAKKEGSVVWYGSEDLMTVTAVAKAFEAKYPGIKALPERSGAERNFQRVSQEYDSGIHAVDVISSSNPAPMLVWKRNAVLAPYLPAEVAAKWPAEARDPDGFFAADCLTFSVMGYNTRLLKAEDAPKSLTELLEPKWKGKLVKAHPGYSGVIVTTTIAVSKALGWDFFEKLGKQQVLQVQSATEPPKKLALGERPVMVDGSEATALVLLADGAPIKIIYPSEGATAVTLNAGLMAAAPHPNAARLFLNFMYSREGQQAFVDTGFRSFSPDVKEPASWTPFAQIKRLTVDPAEQEKLTDEVKARYAKYFGT